MFTGLIEEIGHIRTKRKSARENILAISCNHVLDGVGLGDSIAVNGVCLTVISFSRDGFEADVSRETWQRSNLKDLETGGSVNLERALRVGGKMGGHFVQGHVDGVGTFNRAAQTGDFFDCFFSVPGNLAIHIVEKGSIAVNGISLTVARFDENSFSAAVVPHTWRNTNLHTLQPGDPINIEVDILAKYVFRLLHASGLIPGDTAQPENKLSLDFLAEHGFL